MSAETAVVHFDLGLFGASATKPTLNGLNLCDLVSAPEAADDFDVVGGYDELLLVFNLGLSATSASESLDTT